MEQKQRIPVSLVVNGKYGRFKGQLHTQGQYGNKIVIFSCYATFVSSEPIDGSHQILLTRKALRLKDRKQTVVVNNPGQLVIPGGGVDVPKEVDSARTISDHYQSLEQAIKVEGLRELGEETHIRVNPGTGEITLPDGSSYVGEIQTFVGSKGKDYGGCAIFVDKESFRQIQGAMSTEIPNVTGVHAELDGEVRSCPTERAAEVLAKERK